MPMPPELPQHRIDAARAARLRDEHGLLAELLQIDRTALRNYMAYAARTLTRVRSLLPQRARDPEQFIAKLGRLRSHYAQLLRRTVALSMPSLARLFEQAVQSLDAARAAEHLSGDACCRRWSTSTRYSLR